MAGPEKQAPGFVVLRETADGRWEVVGEADRRAGLTARAARRQAVLDVTNGTAQPGEVYAAMLRSEWRVSRDVEV
jgi:hypothetical protein